MKKMRTTHKIIFSDARDMGNLDDNSVHLMITSPPYPMIQMWDEMFAKQNPKIKKALCNGNGEEAFELMHQELDKVWSEVYRVLDSGGIACINIGDATRTIGGKFQIYTNHRRILNHCLSLGFHALPSILWVKETNKPDKFMGSGMLPPGAYVTLEHEHILVLRKDKKREFNKPEEKFNRQKSAFFWEERNVWFSDKWRDIKGVLQKLEDKELRSRSAAYPFEVVYRLISMFSVQGDIVLDPYLGTGTTTLGAITLGRNSVGFEIDSNFRDIVKKRIEDMRNIANRFNESRIEKHKEFVKGREEKKGKSKYWNKNYKFPVVTRQETNILFPILKDISEVSENLFEVEHG